MNRSSSWALRSKSVDGEPGGLAWEVRGGAGGGAARMLSRRSLFDIMWSTSMSTSIPGSSEGDMKESPTSSLAGGLKV